MSRKPRKASSGAPRYVNGREVTLPSRPHTPKQLNRENRRHWLLHELRERIAANQYLTPEQRAQSLAQAEQTVEQQLLDEAAVRDAGQQRETAHRLTAETEERAQKFAGAVHLLRIEKPKLSKTAAIKKAASEAGISMRTAWAYLDRAK